MLKTLRHFIRNERGATAIEYGLIVAVLSLAIVVGVGATGTKLTALWGDNNSRVNQGLNAH